MKKHHITLSDHDRTTLKQLLSQGTLSAKKFKRATALLELDRGKSLAEVATTLDLVYHTIASLRNAYHKSGLNCLEDAPRSGRPRLVDSLQRAKITALATSDAPEGYARWSVRLLAEKVVESGICDEISYSCVHTILKKTS